MLKISEEHAAVFKDLEERDLAVQGAISRFMGEATALTRAIQVDAKAHWKSVMEAHGIEGNWRYQDGKLYPVLPPEGAQGDEAPKAV